MLIKGAFQNPESKPSVLATKTKHDNKVQNKKRNTK